MIAVDPGPVPAEPSDRALCRNCRKPLRPFLARVPGYEGHYGYDGRGLFCTLRCGFSWATDLAQAIDAGRLILTDPNPIRPDPR